MSNLEFYMATNSGSGCGLQINANGNSNVYFEIAKQTPGTTQQNKSFDWKNKSFFGLNENEINKVVDWGKFVMTQGNENEIKFPHLNSSQPKNIIFKYQQFNGKFQVAISSMPATSNNQQNKPANPQNTAKTFNCSIEQFSLIIKCLEGNIKSKLVSSGVYDSVILDTSYAVLKKQMFLPKMNIGEKIFTEKKDPNNPNFTQREFLLIVDISYNATTKQMIYTCQK